MFKSVQILISVTCLLSHPSPLASLQSGTPTVTEEGFILVQTLAAAKAAVRVMISKCYQKNKTEEEIKWPNTLQLQFGVFKLDFSVIHMITSKRARMVFG